MPGSPAACQSSFLHPSEPFRAGRRPPVPAGPPASTAPRFISGKCLSKASKQLDVPGRKPAALGAARQVHSPNTRHLESAGGGRGLEGVRISCASRVLAALANGRLWCGSSRSRSCSLDSSGVKSAVFPVTGGGGQSVRENHVGRSAHLRGGRGDPRAPPGALLGGLRWLAVQTPACVACVCASGLLQRGPRNCPAGAVGNFVL
jgi:hypothetical protein